MLMANSPRLSQGGGQHIKPVRRALGDDGQTHGFVRTVHGRGYRFVASVQDRDVVRSAAPSSWGALAPIRYTVSDGLDIAYQVTGGASGTSC